MKTKVSRLVPALALAVAAGLVPDVAALQRRERPPSAFETFALSPSTFVSWAAPIGRVETAESRAIVTAVAYEERHTLQRMRGLRIDLVHLESVDCNLTRAVKAALCARPNAAIYFDEESLPRVHVGIARGNYDNLIGSWRQGRAGVVTTGIDIGGYKFTGRSLDEVAAFIERGMAALETAPRD